MKVTYNWLKEFVDFDLTPQQLADVLTMLGLEVEGMEQQGGGMDDVVVARVDEKRQHPNADKLSLCRVDNGSEVFDVVCGAQNFKQGDTVALAQMGAVLPGEFKIKRSKIRGEESCGMLCSEKELGLADESAGIMVLPEGLSLGQPVFAALGLKDTLMEIGLTPNRADCLSVAGIAREIAAKLGGKVQYPQTAIVEGEAKASETISVTIKDSELCPRYAARYITGCTIAPSPSWLVKRLAAVGMRSINNVVDVTNLVMIELGHPLHAFDCDFLSGNSIVVRRASEGEVFTTLDDQQRVLVSDDLVICDVDRPVALAGIMGGLNSEIRETTRSILLESAWFKPAAIRRTSKRLGLHTESSHRFERGADIEMVPYALDRAAALIAELSGGTIAEGIVDAYPAPVNSPVITLRPERAASLLGVEVNRVEVIEILERLACRVSEGDAGILEVQPPTYRVDLEREIDLVEEIARLKGFDTIPTTLPIARVESDLPTRHQRLERSVRDTLVSLGMNEIINFSFTSSDAADKLLLAADDPRRTAIRLANPLVAEHAVMRTTLLPGVLEVVARNISFRTLDLKLFEIRRRYMPTSEEMPHEALCITGALCGARHDLAWNTSVYEMDFYDVKGVVESLLEAVHLENVTWVPDAPEQYYHPGKSCSIMAGNVRIGTLGEIHPLVLKNFEIEKPVFVFELDFEKLAAKADVRRKVIAPSRYPDISRDVALLAPDDLSSEAVLSCIRSVKAKEIEDIKIFDVYRGAGIPEGSKSIAVRIRYRSYERTLTDDEIGSIHARITSTLVNKLNVVIR